MNIHRIIEEMGLKKYKIPGTEKHCYKGVLISSKFKGVYDYGIGLLEVKFEAPEKLENNPAITITTIDDGVWQGYANKPVDIDEICKSFEQSFGKVLPTEQELNKFLQEFGIYGQMVA